MSGHLVVLTSRNGWSARCWDCDWRAPREGMLEVEAKAHRDEHRAATRNEPRVVDETTDPSDWLDR